MFDLGVQELVVIFLVALLVFGPKRLPELGKTLGKWIVEVRRGVYTAKTQLEAELNENTRDLLDEDVKKAVSLVEEQPGKEQKAGGKGEEG